MKRLLLVFATLCGAAVGQVISVDSNLTLTFIPIPRLLGTMLVTACFTQPDVHTAVITTYSRSLVPSGLHPIQSFTLSYPSNGCFSTFWHWGDPANIKTVVYAVNPVEVKIE